jgi:hypothetical protein
MVLRIIFCLLLSISLGFTQTPGRFDVRYYDTLTILLNSTPSSSEQVAIIKGVTVVGAADGYALYYDRTSSAATNSTTVFKPVSAPGRWFKILGFGGSSSFTGSGDIKVIDTSTLLATVDTTVVTNVLTLGRSEKGDMGGGRFYFLPGAPFAHANNATVWRNGNDDGNWYYDLVQAKHGLNPLLWQGVNNKGGVNTVDQGFQAAINWAANPTYGSLAFQTNVFTGPYSSNRFARLAISCPPGLYTIGSITNPGVSIFGAMGSGYGTEYITNAIVKFQHSPTNYSPMIVCNQSGLTIAGITFSGMRERTITNFHTVTGWGDRTNFTYTGTGPGLSDYDRAAFFFSTDNTNYLGCALLSDLTAGNGIIEQFEDLYSSDATIPSNDSMLVVFGPDVDINGSTGSASALAGPPAILVYGTVDAGPNDIVVKDCFIDNFHAGIVFAYDDVSISRNSKILNTSITRYNWAAVSSAFTVTGLKNVQIDNCIFEGYYVKNSYGEDPNTAYTNKFLRNGRWGIYGSVGDTQVGSLKINGSHSGVSVTQGPFAADSLIVKDFSREAVRLRKPNVLQAWVTNAQQVAIHSLQVQVPFTGSESYNTWSLNSDATGVRLDSNFSVHVGSIEVPILEAFSQELPTAYRMQANYGYPGKMHISSLQLADNVTAFRSVTDFCIATTGDLPQTMTKAVRNVITNIPPAILIYQTDDTPGIRRYSNGAWVRYNETADP